MRGSFASKPATRDRSIAKPAVSSTKASQAIGGARGCAVASRTSRTVVGSHGTTWPVGCASSVADTWWTSIDRAYGMRIVCSRSSMPKPSKTPVLHGGGVGFAWARARSATKTMTGRRYAHRRRVTTWRSTGYSGPRGYPSQGGRDPDITSGLDIRGPPRASRQPLRWRARWPLETAVSELRPPPPSMRRRCRQSHSSRRDSSRGIAGDSPRRSRTLAPGGSPW